MSYTKIETASLLKSGVTLAMLATIANRLYGLDTVHVNEAGEFIHEFQYQVQDAILMRTGNKCVNVCLGRHWFANIPLERGYNPSSDFIISFIRQEILRRAHERDYALGGLMNVVRHSYRNINVDVRPDGAYAALASGFALALFKEPVWRIDLEDVGAQKSGNELSNLLLRFVPESIHCQVLHMLNTYRDQWHTIYGGNPALIYGFTRQKSGGEQLYLTIGAGKCAVTFQFNRLNVLNKDTLKPDAQTASLLKDFR